MKDGAEVRLHPITFKLILATLYKLRTYASDVPDRYTGEPIWGRDDDAVLAILEAEQRRQDNDSKINATHRGR